jgi:tetratricopeptide (TPR) repeat protein
MNVTERINDRLCKEDWAGARLLIRQELRKHPHEHWLLTQLSGTYYEEKKYRRALEFVKKALAEAPNCPLVLWDYAGTLDALGQKRKAISIYKKLLARGVDAIANNECGEGHDWAASLLADCKYRLAYCYKDRKDMRQFAKYMASYCADLRMGIDSIYKSEVCVPLG